MNYPKHKVVLLKDTTEQLYLIAAITANTVRKLQLAIKENNFPITIHGIEIKKGEILALAGKGNLPTYFERCLMPDKISKMSSEEKSFKRKFRYTYDEPVPHNTIPAWDSDVCGNYGNSYINDSLVSNYYEQFKQVMEMLNNPTFYTTFRINKV